MHAHVCTHRHTHRLITHTYTEKDSSTHRLIHTEKDSHRETHIHTERDSNTHRLIHTHIHTKTMLFSLDYFTKVKKRLEVGWPYR